MKLESLLKICHAYHNLKQAAREQLDAAIGSDDSTDLDPRTLTEVNEKFLSVVQREAWTEDELRSACEDLAIQIEAFCVQYIDELDTEEEN